ncbi:MAG: PAS domain S-box protein [bacterium]
MNSQNDDHATDYEFLFKATFEQSDVGMAHVDLEGNIIRLNKALANMLGYEPSELRNMKLSDVTHPEDRDGIFQQVTE